MPVDPFEALAAPVVPVRPRPAFAAELRRRIEHALRTGDPMTDTTAVPSYVPPGYHHVTPYLIVADARRAIEWYRDAFGAELTVDPIVMDDGRVGHCEIRIGDATLQMADEFPEIGAVAPQPDRRGVSFTVYVPDVDATYARAVELGAFGVSAPEDMFYGSRSANIADPFGHVWTISSWLG